MLYNFTIHNTQGEIILFSMMSKPILQVAEIIDSTILNCKLLVVKQCSLKNLWPVIFFL